MNARSLLPLIAAVCLTLISMARAVEPSATLRAITRHVAIDNVCAWPNLTVLPDGSITATIFGQPSHGKMEGAAECWHSADGEFWTRCGVPAPNEPHTARMNLAAGLAKNGDLLVLCSGWTDLPQPPRPKQETLRDGILQTWVCRSADGGKTWTQDKKFPAPDAGWTEFIPFGDIKPGADGALHVACYGSPWIDPALSTKTKGGASWHFRSDDDGRTWRRTSVIGPKHNETTLLHLGGLRWLAAARTDAEEIYRSEDDGATWSGPLRVTARNEVNGHLARLKDGRVILSYGSRVPGQFGVLAKFSADEGATWSAPVRLADSLVWDCGYPSTVQRADGKLVTAWYSKAAVNHERYHMGIGIWDAPAAPAERGVAR